MTIMSGVFELESDSSGIFSFREIYDAYLSCRKRKRNTINALNFEVDLLENLFSLSESLCHGSYQPSRSLCFVTTDPKLREIFASDFRDRIVHHWLVPRLESIFEPKFIHDSYACRKNKGTHAAVKRLQQFMRKSTKNGNVSAWFLQLDIKSFFMSIHKEILFRLIQKQVQDETLLAITKLILDHACTENYFYRGDPSLLGRVPTHKSLFHVPPYKGLPIGNLTSQFFANIYLNELDQYVKHQLKCRFYLRYMDDFVLVDHSPEKLLSCQEAIKSFLHEKLDLELKSESVLKRVCEGADFLGYIIRPDYSLVRNRVIGNLKSKLLHFQSKVIVRGKIGDVSYVKVNLKKEDREALRSIIASYLGHLKHANTYSLTQSLWVNYPYLRFFFWLGSNRILQPIYEPPYNPLNAKSQYRWFFGNYPGFLIFFQIGRFCEFYGEHAVRASKLLGLQLNLGKYGNRVYCGFHVRLLNRFKQRMTTMKIPYIVVAEEGYLRKTLKRRIVTEIFMVQTEGISNEKQNDRVDPFSFIFEWNKNCTR